MRAPTGAARRAQRPPGTAGSSLRERSTETSCHRGAPLRDHARRRVSSHLLLRSPTAPDCANGRQDQGHGRSSSSGTLASRASGCQWASAERPTETGNSASTCAIASTAALEGLEERHGRASHGIFGHSTGGPVRVSPGTPTRSQAAAPSSSNTRQGERLVAGGLGPSKTSARDQRVLAQRAGGDPEQRYAALAQRLQRAGRCGRTAAAPTPAPPGRACGRTAATRSPA